MARRGQQKKWYESPWTWTACGCGGGCILLPLIAVGVLGVGVIGAITGSDIYQETMERIRTDPRVIEQLGEPIDRGWWMTGSINLSGDEGVADVAFPISGPNGGATVTLEGERHAGAWTYHELTVAIEGGPTIDLLLPPGGEIEAPAPIEESPPVEEGPPVEESPMAVPIDGNAEET